MENIALKFEQSLEPPHFLFFKQETTNNIPGCNRYIMGLAESEDSLITKAIKGDKAAFTSLYDLYVDRVYSYARYRVVSQTEAEDITQEVFIRAWKAIGNYKKTGAPFLAWLNTITGNLIINKYRARKRTVPLEQAENCPDTGASIEDNAESALDHSLVRNAVAKLKGIKQQVIMMRFIDDLDYREIAAALRKSECAVRVIQHRALRELRAALLQGQEDL